MSSQLLTIVSIWCTLGVVGLVALRSWMIREQVRSRLTAGTLAIEETPLPAGELDGRFLRRKLFVAGFRSESAPTGFVVATILALLLGVGFVVLMIVSGTVDRFAALLRLLPGGVGEVFLPIAWGGPWVVAILLTLLPTLYVRSRRLRRVREIEQDLPLTLDLLATLAEAGLSFDSALTRLLEAQPRQRPLHEELRLFQVDILAGRQRMHALRRLMRRVEVPWFSIFISAVMHAEQVGSSLAATLRTQADDLRVRRRERALAMAMAIPVKLLFPLIVCFLPGIMTAALGPVIYQIVQVLESFLRGALGG